MVRSIDVNYVDRVKKHPDLVLSTVPSGQTAIAKVRTNLKPFDNPKVRKALRLAVDTQKAGRNWLPWRGRAWLASSCQCSPSRILQIALV